MNSSEQSQRGVQQYGWRHGTVTEQQHAARNKQSRTMQVKDVKLRIEGNKVYAVWTEYCRDVCIYELKMRTTMGGDGMPAGLLKHMEEVVKMSLAIYHI